MTTEFEGFVLRLLEQADLVGEHADRVPGECDAVLLGAVYLTDDIEVEQDVLDGTGLLGASEGECDPVAGGVFL